MEGATRISKTGLFNIITQAYGHLLEMYIRQLYPPIEMCPPYHNVN